MPGSQWQFRAVSLRDQCGSSSRVLLINVKKESSSSCQAAGVEAGASLRLLTHVVLNVEFRPIRIVAFSSLQLPENKRYRLVPSILSSSSLPSINTRNAFQAQTIILTRLFFICF